MKGINDMTSKDAMSGSAQASEGRDAAASSLNAAFGAGAAAGGNAIVPIRSVDPAYYATDGGWTAY